MKVEQLKNLIVNILNEKPRFFDGVCAKDIKKLLLDHYDISVSERTIIKVMMEIVEEGEKKFGGETSPDSVAWRECAIGGFPAVGDWRTRLWRWFYLW